MTDSNMLAGYIHINIFAVDECSNRIHTYNMYKFNSFHGCVRDSFIAYNQYCVMKK